jgi:CheY-like chemotaxis protein
MPNRRILILDDDPAVGQTIQWIAEGLGFEAEYVTSSAEFFERLSQNCPDIITIDLVMPGLDGVEIMRLLVHHLKRNGHPSSGRCQEVGVGAPLEYCRRYFQADFKGGSAFARW